MIERLMAGVASLALLSAVPTAAWALDNKANDNTKSAIAQQNSDSLVSQGTAVNNGANATNNALGQNTDRNGVAVLNSAAGVLNSDNDVDAAAFKNSTAVENGAFLKGNGVAVGDGADGNAMVGQDGIALTSETDDIAGQGSAVLLGDGNSAAAVEDGSAAADGSSIAINAGGDGLDNGSSAVGGTGNSTASAEEGAAVGRDGTAVGVDNNNVTGEDATAAFGLANVVAAAHLAETAVGNTLIDNNSSTSGIIGVGNNVDITTGNIQGQSVGTMTGANMYVGNTGLANQGDAIGISARSSF